ncbi:hypothetical protein J6590_093106 [Homalodisca vitripennis]|nr:hypothetical protein J6590_093106 [Homalodisca vitripennis]
MHHALLPASQETNSIRPERRIAEKIYGGRSRFVSPQGSGYALQQFSSFAERESYPSSLPYADSDQEVAAAADTEWTLSLLEVLAVDYSSLSLSSALSAVVWCGVTVVCDGCGAPWCFCGVSRLTGWPGPVVHPSAQ